jgi:hypothetical protein
MRTPALLNIMLMAALMTASCADQDQRVTRVSLSITGSKSDPEANTRPGSSPNADRTLSGHFVWPYGGIAGVAFGR